MKFLTVIALLLSSKLWAFHFVEVDALNPIFYGVDTAHSLRTDLRIGKDLGSWSTAFRYATELGVPSDTDGSGVKGRDGNAHTLGLRGAYFIAPDIHIGGGYLFTMFNANTKFNGQSRSFHKNLSGFEFFASKTWNIDRWYLKAELGYHHLFGNFKQSGAGGFAEYDVGQGKLAVLFGREF